MFRLFLFIGIAFIGVGSFAQEDNIKALLPSAEQIEGWTIKDSAVVYNSEDLYLFNNDDAGLYLEYGFQQVINILYQNSMTVKIQLEIYEMSDAGAAYGIFTMNSSGKGVSEDIGDAGMLFDYYLHFVKDNYYVRVTASRKEEATIIAIFDFASIVEENIPLKGVKPELLRAFDLKNKELIKVKYIRGLIALDNIFNFGHGSVAGFSEGISSSWEGKMFFVFAYKNDRERREWFASCKGKMHMNTKFTDYTSVDDGLTVIDKAGNYLSFKPYGKYYMVIKGMNWKEAAPVFKEVIGNLDGTGK